MAVGVTFGGAAGTAVTVTSDTELSVTTPAHAAGVVDVVVTTDNGTATLAGGFTYVTPPPAPTLTSVSPTYGSVAPQGGTFIVFTGTGFSGAGEPRGWVGGTPATLSSTTATTATFALPAGTEGPADVTFTNDNGTATLADAFTYLAVPTITDLDPDPLDLDTATVLTITGTGFAPASDGSAGTNAMGSRVRISGTPLITANDPALTYVSATELQIDLTAVTLTAGERTVSVETLIDDDRPAPQPITLASAAANLTVTGGA
jgi:hypothetical protein